MQHPGRLADLWDVGGSRLASATHVVFVGYRIPPTDAYSRNWLLEGIRAAARASSSLAIHTVLGADVHSADSARLHGMLRKISKVKVLQEPMFAEDFFAVFQQRERLGTPKMLSGEPSEGCRLWLNSRAPYPQMQPSAATSNRISLIGSNVVECRDGFLGNTSDRLHG